MSTWADRYIECLKKGEVVKFRPRGNSMSGRIENGQLVTLDPLKEPSLNDAVLCKVKGNAYVHLVKSVSGSKDSQRFLIGSNKGRINGWIGRNSIFGVVTSVED